MVRVIPLVSALLSLAAIEVVVAKSQQHFRGSSDFLDTCAQIEKSISNDSVVYYSRELYTTPARSCLTNLASLLSLIAVSVGHSSLVPIKHGAVRVQRGARHPSRRWCDRAFPSHAPPLFFSPLSKSSPPS